MTHGLPTATARTAGRWPDLRQLGASASAGFVAAVLHIAVLFSLAALIFSGPLAGYLGDAVGLLLLGSATMMIIFALLSSRPAMLIYSQDAPAIIVAVMAAQLAGSFAAGDGALFPTVLAAVVLTTLATGATFLLLGQFRLGALVRYLPYPVVGGFLAGTGWLLLLGGLGVMLGAQPALADLPGLLAPPLLWRWLPGTLFAIVTLLALRRTRHPLALPALFIGATALFYLWLAVAGVSQAEARAGGWLLAPFAEQASGAAIGPALLTAVSWPALLGQSGTIVAAVVISVIGLLLNVSGLQLARREEFDLNRELRAAGAAQLLGGLLGALPGYHALGISALAHQMGARTRLVGVLGGLIVGGAFFFGVELLALTPQFVLGGLICYLGLAFLAEWLYDAWFQLPRVDYALVAAISLMIAVFGMLPGVAAGLLIAVILFVVAYSRINVVKHALSGAILKSRVTRGFHEQQALRERGEQIAVFQLQGFIFFGTAHDLLERVRLRAVDVALPPLRCVLLDFRLVPGLDSTALLSFAKLRQLAEAQGLTLVFTQLAPGIRRQIARGLPPDDGLVRIFSDLDRGLEWCEDQLLAALPAQAPAPPALREQLAALAPGADGLDAMLAAFERRAVAPGDYLIRQGEEPEDMFFIEAGQVTAQIETPGLPPQRLETMGGGRAVGELGFYLGRRRTAAVVADQPGHVLRVTRQALRRLAAEQPAAASTFHLIMARLLSERVVHLVDTVEALQL
jgi:SulP family sulfate permease